MAAIRDSAVRREVCQIAEQAHVELAYAGQPAVLTKKLDPNSLDRSTRSRAVDVLKGEIDAAYEMRAIGFAFLSGPDPGASDRDRAVDALTKTCDELCDHAARLGSMPVVLESFDRDVDKCALVGPNSLAADIAARLDRDNFGLLIDLSHLPLQKESVDEALTSVRRHLRHAHIGNCFVGDHDDAAYGDQHPRFGYPGSQVGVSEITEYLRGLIDIGYLDSQHRAVLSFEIKPVGEESAELIIANAKRMLRRGWLSV
jgi:sugar phosphate isomerase/epimerase